MTISNLWSCAVITPVGPGHEETYFSYCLPSIEHAISYGTGPFVRVEPIDVPDLQGNLGRSRARNLGVVEAVERGFDWIFFLDADDFLFESVFEDAASHLLEVDALWGLICEARFGDLTSARLRPNQVRTMDRLDELLGNDPFMTLQMGHFVRAEVAAAVPFDERMDTGEDFRYYRRVWSRYRCKKMERVFFLNVRGRHSTGPRSADGRMWREAVEMEVR